MDIKDIVDALILLNDNTPLACTGDIIQLLECNLHSLPPKLQLDYPQIIEIHPEIARFNENDPTIIWKYIVLNLHLIVELKTAIQNHQDLSIQQKISLKHAISQFIGLSLRCNLMPKLPQHIKLTSESFYNEKDVDMKQYDRLISTLYVLIDCYHCIELRPILDITSILNGLYQILYCPIKKPDKIPLNTYNKLMTHREIFAPKLETIIADKLVYIRETMLLLSNNTCAWFLKAVGFNLTQILKGHKGLESIAQALLENSTDYDPNDTAKTWQTQEVIVKLVMSLKDAEDFETNILVQVKNLLSRNQAFLRIFLACLKELCKEKHSYGSLLDAVLNFERSELALQKINILHELARENWFDVHFLDRKIVSIFTMYAATPAEFAELKSQLQFIALTYIKKRENEELYDVLLFKIVHENIAPFKSNFEVKPGPVIVMVDNIKAADLSQALVTLVRTDKALLTQFFVYLLNCLNRPEKYFADNTSFEHMQNNLMVLNLLTTLADDKSIQSYINKNPASLINYIQDELKKGIEDKVHLTQNVLKQQPIFITLMILQALTSDGLMLQTYNALLEPLKVIASSCCNEELRLLAATILKTLKGDVSSRADDQKSVHAEEFEKAVEDVCDPLLPVRGHGLMTLTKMIESKNPVAIERKMYILNIFQQSLKNDDSFIYISAINGLASMADIFPDLIIGTLVDEYAESTNLEEDGSELRMKLGEVLVRVTKKLGDEAPKYKALLLNTFLVGSKDDDHLIRASSLSNLGEICRVLGYKLGEITNEVLECAHRVITTDKAVEARRAAITVLRQTCIGLGSNLITFLNEDAVEIYRTLRKVYNDDEDEIMRLQAQLALEELAECVKKYIFANPELDFAKLSIMFD